MKWGCPGSCADTHALDVHLCVPRPRVPVCPALLQTVLDVMRNCDSLDSRQQVMAAIIKSSAEVSWKQGARQCTLGCAAAPCRCAGHHCGCLERCCSEPCRRTWLWQPLASLLARRCSLPLAPHVLSPCRRPQPRLLLPLLLPRPCPYACPCASGAVAPVCRHCVPVPAQHMAGGPGGGALRRQPTRPAEAARGAGPAAVC